MNKLNNEYFLKLIRDYLEAEEGKEGEELEDFLYDNSCSDVGEFLSVLDGVKYNLSLVEKENEVDK